MTGIIAPTPKFQFFSATGIPLVGGTVTTYLAGTTTLQGTWQNQALTTANTNPIVLDARGECVIWLDSAVSYKFVLKNRFGVIQWTQDNINSAFDISASSGSSLVGFLQSGIGAVASTAQAKLRERISVEDFGAVGDWNGTTGTDDTVAIQKAIDACGVRGGGKVYFAAKRYKITAGLVDRAKTVILCGEATNEDPGSSGVCTMVCSIGAIAAWTVTGNRSGARDITFQGDGGAYNANAHGMVINGSRSLVEHVSCINNRGNGFHYIYGNQSYFSNLLALNNKGHGVYIGDAITSVDDNAACFVHVDCRVNQKSGVYADTSISFANNFHNLVVQGNVEWGYYCNATYYNVYGFYAEANGLGSICFGAASANNRVAGILTATYPPMTDLSASKKNWVEGYSMLDQFYQTQALTVGGAALFGTLGQFVLRGIPAAGYTFELQGTSTNQTIPMTSTGGGIVTFKPDAMFLEALNAPVLLNSWVNFGGSRTVCGYWKDSFGMVQIQGTIKSGTTASPTLLFNLPVGYRPSGRIEYAVRSNGAFGSVFIDSDGNVYFDTGTNVEFSLDGISFRTT